MPARTTSDRATIEVPKAVRDQLKRCQERLHSDMGRSATMGEILSALLLGVPLWQLEAMLAAYRPSDNPGPSTDDSSS